MCGIIGLASTTKSDYKERGSFISQALFVDTMRGTHSTGVFGIKHDQKKEKGFYFFKDAISGVDFINTESVKSLTRLADHYKFIVGHNRAASFGKISKENAHPFYKGKIVMVHNGTLFDFKGLSKSNFNVDSEFIAHALDQEGPEKVLPKLKGAYALVWYDFKEDKLFFARNNERPLSLAISDGGKTVFFASEEGMLDWLVKRNGFEVEKLISLESGKLLSLSGEEGKPFEMNETPFTINKAVQTYHTGKGGSKYRHIYDNYDDNYDDVDFSLAFKRKDKDALKAARSLNVVRKKHVKFIIERVFSRMRSVTGSEVVISFYGKLVGTSKKIDHVIAAYSIPESFLKNKSFKGTVYSGMVSKITHSYAKHVPCFEVTDIKEVKIGRVEKTPKVDTISPAGTFKGPKGFFYPKESMIKLIEGGCDNCCGNIDLEDIENVKWTEEDYPICPECVAANPELSNIIH